MRKRELHTWLDVLKGPMAGITLFVFLFFPGQVKAQNPLTVAVSIPPQAFFVKQIGGNRVKAQVLLPPGANPATYEPKAAALIALSRAVLYFRIHVPFENAWIDKFRAVNRKIRVVDTTKGLKGLLKGDPHTWLSPSMVRYQAGIIAHALANTDPAGKPIYEKNLKQFLLKIDALTKRIKNRFLRLKRRTFLVYHPCWGYFARDFGLKQMAIEHDGKAPGAALLSRLIVLAKREGIHCIFAQPQFDTRSAAIIARQIYGRLVLIDPMVEDWDKNLAVAAEKIATCLEK